MISMLLSSLQNQLQRPGEALSDVDTTVLETVHPLHQRPVDVKWGLISCVFPKSISYQLLGLADIQKEVVVLTLTGQALYFLQVVLFIVIRDQVHHSCVVSKLDNGVCVERGYTVMFV